MHNKEGIFIVVEGTDGSGKSTQFKLLLERLGQAGYDTAEFDFPRYSEPSSYFVKQYLNGKYGGAEDVSPYTASLFYALDRFEAGTQIRQAIKDGKIVVANRFTGSNMAHQGTKFRHADERRGFFIWLDNLEFEMLNVPRPNLNLVLHVPADIAQGLVDKKPPRDYTDKKRDIHEADLDHLSRSVEVYDDMCQLFPKDFVRIDCVRNNQLLPVETVSNLLWEKVFPFLPKPSRPRKIAKAEVAAEESVALATPYIAPDGLSAKDVSSLALVRLALTHDLKITEQASDEQHGYTVPAEFDAETKQRYSQDMNRIFELYDVMLARLAAYIRDNSQAPKIGANNAWNAAALDHARASLRGVLPVATRTSATVSATSLLTLENLMPNLMEDDLPEVRQLAIELEKQATEIYPALSRAKKAGQSTRKTKKLAEEYLAENHAEATNKSIQLTDVWPRNELQIVPDILYEYSGLPLRALKTIVESWTYDKKLAVFKAYTSDSQNSGRAFEKVYYNLDVICDFAIFSDLERSGLNAAASLEHQQLTPRLGFEIPKLVEDAGLTDMYEECFDISLSLHSLLQKNGYAPQAQYATLKGHKMRWSAAINAVAVARLIRQQPTTRLHPQTHQLLCGLQEVLAETHPLQWVDTQAAM